jgi:hypothetical protein
MSKAKGKWKFEYGVAVFVGKKKVSEYKFKTEKDMAYWLYKNEVVLTHS